MKILSLLLTLSTIIIGFSSHAKSEKSKKEAQNHHSIKSEEKEPGHSPKHKETVKPLPFVYIGNPSHSNTPEILAYFSPTCTHCSEFFKEQIPLFINNYINKGKLKMGIRIFPANGWDLAIAKLCWFKGEKMFFSILSNFLTQMEKWMPYIFDKSSKKRLTFLSLMLRELPPQYHKSNIQEKLNITIDDELSSIKLFALQIGFSPEEVEEALVGESAKKMGERLIATGLEARDEKGNEVNFVPIFYFNGKLFEDTIEYKDLPNLLEDSLNESLGS